jgi:hypothetical protein
VCPAWFLETVRVWEAGPQGAPQHSLQTFGWHDWVPPHPPHPPTRLVPIPSESASHRRPTKFSGDAGGETEEAHCDPGDGTLVDSEEAAAAVIPPELRCALTNRVWPSPRSTLSSSHSAAAQPVPETGWSGLSRCCRNLLWQTTG